MHIIIPTISVLSLFMVDLLQQIIYGLTEIYFQKQSTLNYQYPILSSVHFLAVQIGLA